MKWQLIEVCDDLQERVIGSFNRKTERGVFLAWVTFADRRYGAGKWRVKNGGTHEMFGGYMLADDGRCLSIKPDGYACGNVDTHIGVIERLAVVSAG
jgi:hypothetical protein